MTDATLRLNVDSKPAVQGFKEYEQASDKAKRQTREVTGELGKAEKQSKDFGRSLGGLKSALAGVAAALSVRQILDYAESYRTLENRIRVAQNGMGDVTRTMNQIAEISQRTRSPLEANVQLFQRISMAQKELNATGGELLQFTQNIGMALAIQGGSASSASGALLQLVQAMGAGVVRAEEFNSVLEGAFPVAQAAARGIDAAGGSVAKLRQLIADGQITSEQFFKAILSQSASLEQSFVNTVGTIGQAFTVLNTSMTTFIGQSKAVQVIQDAVAGSILLVAENLDVLTTAVIAVGGALVVNYVAGMVAATAATATFSGVVGALGAILATAIPVAALAGAIFTVITYFDELKATFTVVAAEAAKFASSVYGTIVGALRGIGAAVTNTGDVLGGFLLDLKEFALNPLGDNAGFDNFKRDIKEGYGDAFRDAFAEAKKEAADLNDYIDNDTNQTLIQLKRKADEAGKSVETMLDVPAGGGAGAVAGAQTPLEGAIKEASKATEELGTKADETAEIFKTFATNIQNSFTSMFKDAFTGNINSLRDFGERFKDMFADLLANLTTLAIASPIIVPIVTAVGGSLGLSSGAIQSVTGQLGGGDASGLGGLGSLSSLLGSGGGDIFGSITSYINDAASGIFGTASSTAMGPFMPGQGTLTSILGDTFSGAGFGGLAANLLGLGSGNMFVDTGLSLAGSALGNMIFPGIGGIVGSFAGTALGGLFGGKSRPHPASNFGAAGFTAGGQLIDPVASSKHAGTEQANALMQLVNQNISGLAASTGLDFSSINSFQGGVDDGRGFFSLGDFKKFDQNTFTFDPADEKSADEAFSKVTLEMVRRVQEATGAIRDDLLPAFQKITVEGRASGEVLSDIAFIANFDKIGDAFLNVKEPATAFESQMQTIRTQFDEARASAERLGLPLDELAAKLDAVEGKIRNDFNRSLADQLLGTQSGIFGDLAKENERYQTQLKDAKAINGDLALVEAIHAANLEKINNQYTQTEQTLTRVADDAERTLTTAISGSQTLVNNYSRITQSLSSAIFGLQTGGLSSLSPSQQLALAQQKFSDTAARARGGDLEAAAQLPEIGETVLTLARDFYASSDAYDMIFSSIINELDGTREIYQTELQIAQNTLSVAQLQLEELRRANSLAQAALDSQGAANDNTAQMVQSLANSSLQVRSGNANEQLLRDWAGYSASQQSTALSLLQSASPGVTPGNGARSLFFDQNLAANDALRNALRGAGIPGFAAGGSPFSTSPSVVGENGPEILTPRAGSMVIPIQNNSAMLNQMVSSNRHLSATVRVLQSGMKAMQEQQRMTNEQLMRLNTSQKRKR